MRLTLSLLVLLAVSGCEKSWKAKTHSVQGSVFINEAPAVDCVVRLLPKGDFPDSRQTCPYGLVKQDGTFVISMYEYEDGAPLGDYFLTLTWPQDLDQPGSPDRLQGKFSTRESNVREVSVIKGGLKIDPIKLSTIKVLPAKKHVPKDLERSF